MIESPLVVGYKGEIGSFILQGLLKHMPKASDIWCVDVNDTKEEVEFRIKKSKFIFLCIPIQDTVSWLIEYHELLRDKLIFEQCSLKSIIFDNDVLRTYNLNNIKSMHLLFRPSSTPDSKDRKCVFIENQFDSNFDLHTQLEILKIVDSAPIIMDDHEMHDMMMASHQALVHRVVLVLNKQLRTSLEAFGCSTYVSSRITEMANRIKLGDPILYKTIQDNKFAGEFIENFKKDLDSFDIMNYMKGKL